MKLVCFDKNNCGFSTLEISNNLEYNIDIESLIQLCPECKQSLAMLVDDFYVMESNNPAEIKRKELENIIQNIERNIKL